MTGTAANINERESLWNLLAGVQGTLIADKGLIGRDYREELMQYSGINRSNRFFQPDVYTNCDWSINSLLSYRAGSRSEIMVFYQPYCEKNTCTYGFF